MNSKDHMIYVERIVRPVGARQSRKLRMRRELLAHLEAALEEERYNRSDDAAAALEQAKRRLGDPADLTRELQGSVPLIERLLHTGTPHKWNGWEKRAARRMYLYAPVTLAHWFILYGTGAIALIIVWMCSPHMPPEAVTTYFVDQMDHPIRVKTIFAIIWAVQMIWLFVGLRFLALAASPVGKFPRRRVIRSGIEVLISQGLLMLLIVTQMLRRSPTVAEMVQSLGVSLLLLPVAILVGRGLAALRWPYDEWLLLDLAQVTP